MDSRPNAPPAQSSGSGRGPGVRFSKRTTPSATLLASNSALSNFERTPVPDHLNPLSSVIAGKLASKEEAVSVPAASSTTTRRYSAPACENGTAHIPTRATGAGAGTATSSFSSSSFSSSSSSFSGTGKAMNGINGVRASPGPATTTRGADRHGKDRDEADREREKRARSRTRPRGRSGSSRSRSRNKRPSSTSSRAASAHNKAEGSSVLSVAEIWDEADLAVSHVDIDDEAYLHQLLQEHVGGLVKLVRNNFVPKYPTGGGSNLSDVTLELRKRVLPYGHEVIRAATCPAPYLVTQSSDDDENTRNERFFKMLAERGGVDEALWEALQRFGVDDEINADRERSQRLPNKQKEAMKRERDRLRKEKDVSPRDANLMDLEEDGDVDEEDDVGEEDTRVEEEEKEGGDKATKMNTDDSAAASSTTFSFSSIAAKGALITPVDDQGGGADVEKVEEMKDKKLGKSKAKESEMRPPTDRELALTILQQTLPGFETATAEEVARNWGEVEAYLADLGIDSRDVLEGRAAVGPSRRRIPRDMDEHPSNSAEGIDPHTLSQRLGRRGRFYQERWDEDAFIAKSRLEGVFEPVYDWSDVVVGYRDNHDGAYRDYMKCNLPHANSWDTKLWDMKVNKRSAAQAASNGAGSTSGISNSSSSAALCDTDESGMFIIAPPVPVALHHPAAWGLHKRNLGAFLKSQNARGIHYGSAVVSGEESVEAMDVKASESTPRTRSQLSCQTSTCPEVPVHADIYQYVHPAAFTPSIQNLPGPTSPAKILGRPALSATTSSVPAGRVGSNGEAHADAIQVNPSLAHAVEVVPACAAPEDSDELSLLFEKAHRLLEVEETRVFLSLNRLVTTGRKIRASVTAGKMRQRRLALEAAVVESLDMRKSVGNMHPFRPDLPVGDDDGETGAARYLTRRPKGGRSKMQPLLGAVLRNHVPQGEWLQTVSNGESVELKAEDGRWTPGVVISRHFDNGLLRIVKILPLPSRGQKRQLDGAGCWLTVEDARIAQPGTHVAVEDVKWSVEQWHSRENNLRLALSESLESSQPLVVNGKSKIIDLTGPTSAESSPTTHRAGGLPLPVWENEKEAPKNRAADAASPPRATIILRRNSSSLPVDTSTAKGGFSSKKKKNSSKSSSGSSSKKRKSGQQPDAGKSVCPEVLETKIAGSSGGGSSTLGASVDTDKIETGPEINAEVVADEMVIDDDSVATQAQLGYMCIDRGGKGDEGPTADAHEEENDNMETETDDADGSAMILVSGDA